LIEEWRDVVGYEGIYKVSNLGNIKNSSGREMSKSYHMKGYVTARLTKNKIGKTFLIHRIVAMAFIKNENNKPSINHKDGDKKNNKVDNLEWCTQEENVRHAVNNGLFKGRRKKGEDYFWVYFEAERQIFRSIHIKNGVRKYIKQNKSLSIVNNAVAKYKENL
jgi:hypothetical protein